MSVRLKMDGLAELRAALRALPDDLAQEAAAIVQAQAEYAQQQIVAAYPERTTNLNPGPTRKSRWFPPGILKARVTSTREPGAARFGARAVVRSRAPHAWLFENGTKPRQTRNGASRGRMPVAPESERMIPIAIRRRRVMVQALIDLVRRAGFNVETSA